MATPFIAVREVAVQRGVCPVSLIDLRVRPDQVGAVTRSGVRVEPALYHRSSALNSDGSLIHGGTAPVSGLSVDGFQLMPAITDRENFVSFLDWSSSDKVNVTDLAVAFAARLPLDEDATERFIRDRFHLDRNGRLSNAELQDDVLPYLARSLGELLAAAPATTEPKILQDSDASALRQWFDYWDVRHASELPLSELRFAVAREIYKALEDTVSIEAKEAMLRTFFEQADLIGEGCVTRDEFLDLLSPAFKANLAAPPRKSATGAHHLKPGGRKIVWEGDAAIAAPMATLRLFLENPATGDRASVEVPRNGNVGDLRSKTKGIWSHSGPTVLWLDGRILAEDAVPLSLVTGLRGGATVQVLPDGAHTDGGCAIV